MAVMSDDAWEVPGDEMTRGERFLALTREIAEVAILSRWGERGGELTALELDTLHRRDPESIYVRDERRRAEARANPPPPPFWRFPA